MGKTKQVLEEIKKLSNVESISVVTGPFDIIITISVEKLEELYDLTYIKLAEIPGINQISTHIVEKEIISEHD